MRGVGVSPMMLKVIWAVLEGGDLSPLSFRSSGGTEKSTLVEHPLSGIQSGDESPHFEADQGREVRVVVCLSWPDPIISFLKNLHFGLN